MTLFSEPVNRLNSSPEEVVEFSSTQAALPVSTLTDEIVFATR